jgi:hypothetical protein
MAVAKRGGRENSIEKAVKASIFFFRGGPLNIRSGFLFVFLALLSQLCASVKIWRPYYQLCLFSFSFIGFPFCSVGPGQNSETAPKRLDWSGSDWRANAWAAHAHGQR